MTAPPYTIIEEDGKLYAHRTLRLQGRDHDLYQRLETRESKPRKMWHGTRLAADAEASAVARFKTEIAAFKEKQ